MGSLVVCAACSRHVRRRETSCPFCGVAISDSVANTPERALPSTRLSRAALMAFAAASVGAVNCGGTVDGTSGEGLPAGGTASVGGAMNTGGAINVGGTINFGGTTNGTGGEVFRPPYGSAPPFDSGILHLKDAGTPDAARRPPFGREALYGAPPPPPRGHDGGFAFYARPEEELVVTDETEEDDPVG